MIANLDNMLDIFNKCNIKYFEGKLLLPQFGLLHSFRTCGYFKYTRGSLLDKTIYDSTILITDYYDFTESQFVDIMCHEMIHYYLVYFNLDRRHYHGKKFKEMANMLNRMYNLNITTYLDLSKYQRRTGTPSLSYWIVKKLYM